MDTGTSSAEKTARHPNHVAKRAHSGRKDEVVNTRQL